MPVHNVYLQDPVTLVTTCDMTAHCNTTDCTVGCLSGLSLASLVASGTHLQTAAIADRLSKCTAMSVVVLLILDSAQTWKFHNYEALC